MDISREGVIRQKIAEKDVEREESPACDLVGATAGSDVRGLEFAAGLCISAIPTSRTVSRQGF